jgi:hypothetical protein
MRRAFVQLHVCRATHHLRWSEAKKPRISLQSGPQLKAAADGLKPLLSSTAQLLCVAQYLSESQI